MQEVKVQCDCGQKYKFDVEPVNGRMPFRVNCPICGVDGTPKANDVLSANGGATAPAISAIPVAVMAAPRAVAAAPMAVAASPATVAVAAPAPPQLRINRSAPPAPLAAAEPGVAVATLPTPGPIAPISNRASPARPAAGAVPGRPPNFGLGLAGALAGAAVGGIVYFLICYFMGFHLLIVGRLLSIGVGYLAGLGADLLGRKEGSKELGALAAVFALVCICAAQYCNARIWWNHGHGDDNSKTVYQESVAEAKKIVAAVPTGSDQEIRAYLASEDADTGEKPDLAAVTDDAIKEFRETTLPEMRKLASGQTTSQEFEKKAQAETAQSDQNNPGEKSAFTIYLLFISVRRSNILGLIAAAATAFKVASNA